MKKTKNHSSGTGASKYRYDENGLTYEERDNNRIWYLYDANGIAGFILQRNGVNNTSAPKETFYFTKKYIR